MATRKWSIIRERTDRKDENTTEEMVEAEKNEKISLPNIDRILDLSYHETKKFKNSFAEVT